MTKFFTDYVLFISFSLVAGDLSGGLYAGATAGNGVGASAGLGGEASKGGYGGAEAHAGGVSKTASVSSLPAVRKFFHFSFLQFHSDEFNL